MQQTFGLQTDSIFLPTSNYPNRKFTILRKLGEGSEGQVFLAKPFDWGNFQQNVALKVERQMDSNILEFIQKVRKYQEQENDQHPDKNSQIIKIYELSQYENKSITIMEVGDINLYDYLNNMKGQLTIQEKLKILRQITQSIYYMHSQNFMHRDIKPENFMKVGQDYKLIDFGLTKNSQLLYKTANIGSKLFQAPEILCSNYSNKIDIWSLGCVFYEILSEEQFPIDPTNIHLNIKAKLPFPTQMEMNLQNLVQQMLQVDPLQRKTAQQVWEEIKKIESQIFQQPSTQNSQFLSTNKFGQISTQNSQIQTISTSTSQPSNQRFQSNIQNTFQNPQNKTTAFPIFNQDQNDFKNFIKQQFDEFKMYCDQKFQNLENKLIQFETKLNNFEEKVGSDLSELQQNFINKISEQKNIIEQLPNLQSVADLKLELQNFIKKENDAQEDQLKQIIIKEFSENRQQQSYILQEIRQQQSTILQNNESLEKQLKQLVNDLQPKPENQNINAAPFSDPKLQIQLSQHQERDQQQQEQQKKKSNKKRNKKSKQNGKLQQVCDNQNNQSEIKTRNYSQYNYQNTQQNNNKQNQQ